MSDFDEKLLGRIKRLEREVERLRAKESPDMSSYLGITAKAADSDKLNGISGYGYQQSLYDVFFFELGYNRTGDGPAYIDFHTIADQKDYDARIIALGGTSVHGGASIEFHGSSFNFSGNALLSAGDGYFVNNVSALSFTDRTPFYEGDALAEIKNIRGITNSKSGETEIDHDSLPDFVRVKRKNENGNETDERDLGAMISMLTVAIQQLTDRVEKLESRKI